MNPQGTVEVRVVDEYEQGESARGGRMSPTKTVVLTILWHVD